jgi:alkylation response protein AidB-like acyl-CoA dehydrogenase
MAMLATMSVDNPDDTERQHDFSLAKVGVGQAGRYVSQSAVQMHGGIGMTEEYAVGHYFRRCMVIERLFGDPAYYLHRLANEIR